MAAADNQFCGAAGMPAAAGPAAPLVLASASPRRAELMAAAGYSFSVMASRQAEPARRPASVPVRVWPASLAVHKAQAVAARLKHPAMVVGADTIVVLDRRIINKARTRGHAREILRRLSGRRHEVITGVAIVCGEVCRFGSAVAVCRMKKMSDRWLERYLDSGLWRGKAGAYGIQDGPSHGGGGDPVVELLAGEWSTVVGLPLELLNRELAAVQEELKHQEKHS